MNRMNRAGVVAVALAANPNPNATANEQQRGGLYDFATTSGQGTSGDAPIPMHGQSALDGPLKPHKAALDDHEAALFEDLQSSGIFSPNSTPNNTPLDVPSCDEHWQTGLQMDTPTALEINRRKFDNIFMHNPVRCPQMEYHLKAWSPNERRGWDVCYLMHVC